jgi:hypothetical protein
LATDALGIVSLGIASLGTDSANAASVLVAAEVKHTKQSKSQKKSIFCQHDKILWLTNTV